MTCSINSLPIEIKTIIVNLANLQDENYQSRMAVLNYSRSGDGVLSDNKWRGKSLNALFLVNKEWSNLAAVHLFKDLNSYTFLIHDYKFTVLPRRIQLIRFVCFIADDYAFETFGYLSTFPNLYHLHFNSKLSHSLFGLIKSLLPRTKDQKNHLLALSYIAPRITKLSLSSITTDIFSIFKYFPNVKDLNLTFSDSMMEYEKGEPGEEIGVLLAERLLERLEIWKDTSIPSSWAKRSWKSATTLKVLSLKIRRAPSLSQSIIEFLNMFSDSLEHLTLKIDSLQINLPLSVPLNSFTRLLHLDVECPAITLSTFLNLFQSSSIISLQFTTDNSASTIEDIIIDQALSDFIEQHLHSLKQIEYFSLFLNPQLPTVIALCTLHRIHLVFTVRKDRHPQLTQSTLSDQEQFDYRQPILDKAFEFGKNRLEELRNENDVEGLKEMFDNCKWLRASLAERKD